MPNLKKYLSEGGVEFVNHVAVVPVCGPSRSSLLAGRFPHNVGYVANGAQESIAAWNKLQNNTVGTWMRKQNYHTAFIGKYVNGMECDVPMGWNHWGGLSCVFMKKGNPYTDLTGKLGGTYNYRNASQWRLNFDNNDNLLPTEGPPLKIWDGVHQTEFIANQTLQQAQLAVKQGKPFFIHATPLTVHGGSCFGPQPLDKYEPWDPYLEHHNPDPTLNKEGKPKGIFLTGSPCPTVEHRWTFSNLTNPHLPSWSAFQNGTVPLTIQNAGNPDQRGCCDDWETEHQNRVYRNRTSVVLDLDDMLGKIFRGLEDMGVFDNTYVIFSSDNGYHLGEHRLLFGKTFPYETDTRLPMYVRGPGVPQGEVRPHPTNHLDITATIAELGGAAQHSPFPLDGKSFKDLIQKQGSDVPSVDEWRPFSFSEFYVGQNTWHQVRYINSTTGEAEWALHWWCTNQSEVYHMRSDPYQMNNLAGDSPTEFGKKILDRYLGATRILGECKAEACSVMPPQTEPTPNMLPCHNQGPKIDADEVWMDF